MRASMRQGYRCPNCERTLTLEFVYKVTVFRPGKLEFSYDCDCSSAVIAARFEFSAPALRELFGEDVPELPWVSPFKRAMNAEEINKEVRAWGWELDQVEDVDEFLWWLSHYPEAA